MNLRDLSYLIAVAEERHFGRAAEACFVSQPTLSTQIRKLESELGVTLVERARGRVLLTPVGEKIVERARAALGAVADMEALARAARDPEAGIVQLGVLPTSGPYLMPHVLRRVRERYPRVQLRLVEEKTDALLSRLRTGGLDAVICALPVEDAGLHVEPLFEEPFVLATPAGHRLAGKDDLGIADLAGEQLLLLEHGHCLRDQALDVCRMAGAAEKGQFQATSLETLREMVAVDVGGITLLPLLAVQPPVARPHSLRLTAFAGRAPARRMAMLWRASAVPAELLGGIATIIRHLPAHLLDPTTLPVHAA
ncbi:LysR substrate-binding domain-containing protein [Microbacterium soli]|uniref:Probable hydrogen peroxide-inducible genes activator n=1 Tax=Microbacterium soli TaxID=446075 RepID=A0ABP7N589_9MICO